MNNQVHQGKVLRFAALLLAVGLGLASGALAVEVGDKAPEFKLPATTGLDVSLNDFRGKKWVFLEFYGAAFVPV